MFEFDTNSPKLIERTWKGIPDRWRATAWHAFLTASGKKRPGSPTDEQLIATFHTLINQGSPDDVQIDIDVPRTISSHIMFRRRYRGGQRLLFRVLHCLSIYFPDTGYVQGMAALAATLLCYFDEEMTFVMLVRLWQLRGLEHLYQSGFEGLMQALDEFEEKWLGEREIAIKLVGSIARLLQFTAIRRKLIKSGSFRKVSTFHPQPTAHAGTSLSLIIPSPFPLNSGFGTSLCSLAILTLPSQRLPRSEPRLRITLAKRPSPIPHTRSTAVWMFSTRYPQR